MDGRQAACSEDREPPMQRIAACRATDADDGQLRGGRARRLLRPAAAEAVYLISSFASPPPLTTTDETTTQAAATAVQGARSLVQLIPIATPFAEQSERGNETSVHPASIRLSIRPLQMRRTEPRIYARTQADFPAGARSPLLGSGVWQWEADSSRGQQPSLGHSGPRPLPTQAGRQAGRAGDWERRLLLTSRNRRHYRGPHSLRSARRRKESRRGEDETRALRCLRGEGRKWGFARQLGRSVGSLSVASLFSLPRPSAAAGLSLSLISPGPGEKINLEMELIK